MPRDSTTRIEPTAREGWMAAEVDLGSSVLICLGKWKRPSFLPDRSPDWPGLPC